MLRSVLLLTSIILMSPDAADATGSAPGDTTTAPPPEDTSKKPQEVILDHDLRFHNLVKAQVSARRAEPIDGAVKAVVDNILTTQTKQLTGLWDAMKAARAGLGKIRAKSPGFTPEGAQLPGILTEEQNKKRLKLNEVIAKGQKVMTDIVEKGDYSQVDKITAELTQAAGKPSDSKDSDEQSAATT